MGSGLLGSGYLGPGPGFLNLGLACSGLEGISLHGSRVSFLGSRLFNSGLVVSGFGFQGFWIQGLRVQVCGQQAGGPWVAKTPTQLFENRRFGGLRQPPILSSRTWGSSMVSATPETQLEKAGNPQISARKPGIPRITPSLCSARQPGGHRS